MQTFSFVVRDEIQSFHWNNEPATVHTFMGYYKLKKTTTSLCYLVISENKQHDTIAVHLFQRKLVDFLTQHFGGNKPHKIYCMSDGCAAQYKSYATIMKILEWKQSGTFLLLPTESLCWRDPQANSNQSQPPVTL